MHKYYKSHKNLIKSKIFTYKKLNTLGIIITEKENIITTKFEIYNLQFKNLTV